MGELNRTLRCTAATSPCNYIDLMVGANDIARAKTLIETILEIGPKKNGNLDKILNPEKDALKTKWFSV
jgi:hypothetical protein